ncbi:MAG: hypothetical protein ACUZ8N_02530 [Candidatus Scalindua sp.]
MSIISIKLVYAHKNEPVAQIQLLDYVENNYNSPSTHIYCWETKRFFTYYAPLWDARRARNIDDLFDMNGQIIYSNISEHVGYVLERGRNMQLDSAIKGVPASALQYPGVKDSKGVNVEESLLESYYPVYEFSGGYKQFIIRCR